MKCLLQELVAENLGEFVNKLTQNLPKSKKRQLEVTDVQGKMGIHRSAGGIRTN